MRKKEDKGKKRHNHILIDCILIISSVILSFLDCRPDILKTFSMKDTETTYKRDQQCNSGIALVIYYNILIYSTKNLYTSLTIHIYIVIIIHYSFLLLIFSVYSCVLCFVFYLNISFSVLFNLIKFDVIR